MVTLTASCCRYIIRVEGPALKGKGGQALPVAIAPVRECTCHAGNPLKLWLGALGCSVKYETLRRGGATTLSFSGLQMQVRYCCQAPVFSGSCTCVSMYLPRWRH